MPIEVEICEHYTRKHVEQNKRKAYDQCMVASTLLDTDILIHEVMDRCTGTWSMSFDYRHARCIKLFTEKAINDQVWEDGDINDMSFEIYEMECLGIGEKADGSKAI